MKRLVFAVLILFSVSVACGASQGRTPTPVAINTAAAQGSLNLQWEYSTSPFQPLSAAQDSLQRPYLYIAQQEGGLLILDISDSKRPTKVGGIPTAQFSGLAVTYVAQKDDQLYVALGKFLAAEGSKSGLAVVSVTDPRRPTVTSIWTSDSIARGSSSVLIDGNYVYLAAMSAGVYLFDISNPGQIRLLSSIQPDVNFPKPDPNKVEYPNARGMAIYNGLLFLAYDAGGLRVIDVTDKSNPKEIARYINAGVTGKQQAYNNVVINWPYAYAAIDYCGMEILNIQDVQNIQQVSWWNPWNCQSPSNIWFNSPGHTNQLAFDKDRNLVYLSAGDSELQMVDVSDASRPHLVGKFGEPKDGLGVWGITVSNGMIYLSYVQTLIPFKSNWSGIKAISQ